MPARLTCLLQPADTHCFAMLEASLRYLFHCALIAGMAGKVTWKDSLLHVCKAFAESCRGIAGDLRSEVRA